MTIEITQQTMHVGIILILMGIQIYQRIQIEKVKKEINKLWDQISTFNTMVALKLLENEKNINTLNEKNKEDGSTKKI